MSLKKKWFRPLMEFDEPNPPKKPKEITNKQEDVPSNVTRKHDKISNTNPKSWMKNFDPITVEDLAIHIKKIQEVEEWIKMVANNSNDMLLLTGPVGCGKTITIHTVAAKHHFKVTEWITPLDIDVPTEFGEYQYREKQSTRFLDFIINAANFTSLLDNNSSKLVLIEDFPNVFIRTPSEFTEVLYQYKHRAKSPIIFICSESHTDSKNTAANLFTPSLKEQFRIHHITFNSVSATGLKGALKRVSAIISKKYLSMYNTPTTELIECVVNSSGGDVRSAVQNLHFACLKGSNQNMETSILIEKDTKSKLAKGTKKKKTVASKFLSLGKDETVSILHGVGRVLNPKVSDKGLLSYAPKDIMEQFLSQPGSFINFLHENYLPHFSCPDYVDKAASALSNADYFVAEWREPMCQEYGLYTAIAGLMTANKAPVSAWNPVRGPKSMRIQYPTFRDIPLLEENYLHKRKELVSDYQTYCKIINNSP